ncbi:MAG: hypothetical protein M1269_11695 [Chloroflexi bacterium]|nr:hypothetical protein [Chloroflexota bacterium]
MNKSFLKIVILTLILAGLTCGFYFLYKTLIIPPASTDSNTRDLAKAAGSGIKFENKENFYLDEVYGSKLHFNFPKAKWIPLIYNMPEHQLTSNLEDFFDIRAENKDFLSMLNSSPALSTTLLVERVESYAKFNNHSEDPVRLATVKLLINNGAFSDAYKLVDDMQKSTRDKQFKFELSLIKFGLLLVNMPGSENEILSSIYKTHRETRVQEIAFGMALAYVNTSSSCLEYGKGKIVGHKELNKTAMEIVLETLNHSENYPEYYREAWWIAAITTAKEAYYTKNNNLYEVSKNILKKLMPNCVSQGWADPVLLYSDICYKQGNLNEAKLCLEQALSAVTPLNKNITNVAAIEQNLSIIYSELGMAEQAKKMKADCKLEWAKKSEDGKESCSPADFEKLINYVDLR